MGAVSWSGTNRRSVGLVFALLHFQKTNPKGAAALAAPFLHTEAKGDGMGMSNQTEEKELFHAVSLSGGKDSTAMLLLMIERGLPIDAVLTADTGHGIPGNV